MVIPLAQLLIDDNERHKGNCDSGFGFSA